MELLVRCHAEILPKWSVKYGHGKYMVICHAKNKEISNN